MATETDTSPTTLSSTWLEVTTIGTETGLYVQRLDSKGEVRWFQSASTPPAGSFGHIIKNGKEDISVNIESSVWLRGDDGATVIMSKES